MPGGEDEDDPLQMMLNTKKKREQTDEEMRVRVDEDVERMMENGVKINPCASNVETRRLGSGRAGYLRQSRLPAAEPATRGRAGYPRLEALSRLRATAFWAPEQSLGRLAPAVQPCLACFDGASGPLAFSPSRLLRARYGKATG